MTESTLKDCIAYLYQEAKEKAYFKNRSFTITFKTFQRLVQSNCAYCNIPAHHGEKIHYNEKIFRLNGIDRLSNNLDYKEDTVVACCMYCNFAKSNSSSDAFIDWCHRVSANCQDAPITTREQQQQMIDQLSVRINRRNRLVKSK